MKRILKEYAIELIAGGIILCGISLVVVGHEIRATLLAALTDLLKGILSVLDRFLSSIGSRATTLSASEALGILLALLAVAFIIWRIRYRFHTGKRWAIEACPKCSGSIMRVHRKWFDRVLGATFLPEARRYRCTDPHCGWTGLLRRHISHHHRRSERVPEIENL